jgi:hypothetical protein
LGGGMNEPYDLDRLSSFMQRYRRTDDPDISAAVWALTDLLSGVDVLDNLGLRRGRGAPRKNYANLPLDHPAMRIAMRHALGGLTHEQAVAELEDALGVSDSTAKRALKAMLPRADQAAAALASLLPSGQKLDDLLT